MESPQNGIIKLLYCSANSLLQIDRTYDAKNDIVC